MICCTTAPFAKDDRDPNAISLDQKSHPASLSPEDQMRFMKTIVALCFATVTLPSVSALAQANVNEAQGAVLTVDANLGSDVNAGIGQPLKTLQAAIDKAVANSSNGLPTRVLISPGEYLSLIHI